MLLSLPPRGIYPTRILLGDFSLCFSFLASEEHAVQHVTPVNPVLVGVCSRGKKVYVINDSGTRSECGCGCGCAAFSPAWSRLPRNELSRCWLAGWLTGWLAGSTQTSKIIKPYAYIRIRVACGLISLLRETSKLETLRIRRWMGINACILWTLGILFVYVNPTYGKPQTKKITYHLE